MHVSGHLDWLRFDLTCHCRITPRTHFLRETSAKFSQVQYFRLSVLLYLKINIALQLLPPSLFLFLWIKSVYVCFSHSWKQSTTGLPYIVLYVLLYLGMQWRSAGLRIITEQAQAIASSRTAKVWPGTRPLPPANDPPPGTMMGLIDLNWTRQGKGIGYKRRYTNNAERAQHS